MKKFNRILSFLLAACLIFGMVPTAFAAEDQALSFEVSETILEAVDIIDGGDWKVDDNLTREDTAELLAKTALSGKFTDAQIAAMYGKYENPYQDVSDADWSDGYIAYCTRTGIIAGRDADTFGSEENVTRWEQTKMLLDLLGHDTDDDATRRGYISSIWGRSDWDSEADEPVTWREAVPMTAKALFLPTADTGKTLVEINYGVAHASAENVDELVQSIQDAKEESQEQQEQRQEQQEESNKSFTSYTDRYQTDFTDMARTIVNADMITVYFNNQLSYQDAYRWMDMARMVGALMGMDTNDFDALIDYCKEKGYMPEDQDRYDPITGMDLVKVMFKLMGGSFWLDSAAGQFASIHNLLGSYVDEPPEKPDYDKATNDEITAYESAVMAYLTALNNLLNKPLTRELGILMTYNFLHATMDNGDTVADHFEFDLDKYKYQGTQPLGDGLYYATVVDTVTNQPVNVAVNMDPQNMEVAVYPTGSQEDYEANYQGDVPEDAPEAYIVEVPANTMITVEVFNAIITQILSGATEIFNVTAIQNPDGSIPDGTNGTVTWFVDGNNMGASFNSGTGDVQVNTQALEEPAAAEPPAAEPPAAEPPAGDTPAAETPAAETPAAETPTSEPPAAETPAAETPAE